jgi:hypothetical protein
MAEVYLVPVSRTDEPWKGCSSERKGVYCVGLVAVACFPARMTQEVHSKYRREVS